MTPTELKRVCAKYVRHGAPLYRGTGIPPTDTIQHFRIRKDRRPLNTDTEGTNFYNIAFELLHGIERVRHVCAYTTNRFDQASFYGEHVYLVVPPNDIKYIYHPKISDTKPVLERAMDDLESCITETSGKAAWNKVFKALGRADTVAKMDRLADYIEHAIHQAKDDPSTYEFMSRIVTTTVTDDPEELRLLRASNRVEVALIGEEFWGVPIIAIPDGTPTGIADAIDSATL